MKSRCENIRFQLDHFRATDPDRYQETLEQLRILIRFTPNRHERAAFQSVLNEQFEV